MLKLTEFINLNHDWRAIKAHFERYGIVEIEGFFNQNTATKIRNCLKSDVEWDLIYSNNTLGEIISANELNKLDVKELSNRVASAYDFSNYDFQYIYRVYKLIDNYLAGRSPELFLNRVVETFNSPDYLSFMRELTGCAHIKKMDSMAARYDAGHFLTQHDDGFDEEGREVTYIHNFTEEWRPEWGGILHITSTEKNKIRASFTPKFNSLILFKPPLWHFVSQVSTFTPKPRYTLTGWMLNK